MSEKVFNLSMRVVPRMIRDIRPGIQKCVPGRFCAYRQSQKERELGAVLHERKISGTSDEQREREIRSISSLLIREDGII